jgi:quercetin dioxygenase-like cupin family protein
VGRTGAGTASGDVVKIPPEVKHWHGAAKDSWFSHLAVEIPAVGQTIILCHMITFLDG